jgi:hypothetical protein
MYRYFECKRNSAHRMAVIAHASGAWAQPACDQCGSPTLKIGEGNAPVPPPAGTAPNDPAAAFSDEKQLVLSGTGRHGSTGNHVEYYLKKNEAQEDAILTVTVANRKPHKVRFHLSRLEGHIGDITAESRIKAPFGAQWLTIEPKSDQMERLCATNLSSYYSQPPTMDSKINLSMKLGNVAYGLVHVVAGHHDDLRTLTGAGVLTVTFGGDDAASKKMQKKFEQYRSFLAIQQALQSCLKPGQLQAIYKADDLKWIFVGLWQEKCLLVVTRKNGSNYDIITLYIGPVGGINAVSGYSNRRVAWRLKAAKLPPIW